MCHGTGGKSQYVIGNRCGPWETVLPVIEDWQGTFKRYHVTYHRVKYNLPHFM